jgi:hypothetical protein
MDVDASERRPDGGSRRSHGTPMMQHPAANAPQRESNVFQINAIRSYFHGLVTPRPIGAPWPRQVVWHDVPKIGV